MIWVLAALLALLSPISFASAQTPIHAELDAPFFHEGSGITVPAQLGSFARTSVTDLAEQELNIAIQLQEPSDETALTLYIYRAAASNISIWGDFSSIRMLNNPAIGRPVEGSFFLGRFSPPNGSGDGSALHARTMVEGAKARSTGLSVFAHNDWIVKLRATSNTLSDEELTVVMGRVLSQLKVSPSEVSYPPVTLVQPCKKPIKFGKGVAMKSYSGTGRLVVAMEMKELSVSQSGADDPINPWCRDTQSNRDYAIYRRDNSKSDYFLALSDGGFGAFIKRARVMMLMGSVTGYLVKSSDGITETAWPLFDKRPHPILVRDGFGDMSPVATQDVRPGAEGNFTIMIPVPRAD